MRILHTIARASIATGGPAEIVSAHCRTLFELGDDVTLLTGTDDLADVVKALPGGVRIRTVPIGPYSLANFSRAFARACDQEVSVADVVHAHGVWLHPNWTTMRASRLHKRPCVRSPHGMLARWALRRSPLRKRLIWWLQERRLHEAAALVHAASAAEGAQLRRMGITRPIAVIPYGIDLAGEYSAARLGRLRRELGQFAGERRTILFLSRIHPKKGLDILLRAWGDLGPSTHELVIAGPGDAAMVTWLQKEIGTRLGASVRYVGVLQGEAKLRQLLMSDALVLPSHSENYGMVVAEALACGVPVITSRNTPWQEVERVDCGWYIEATAADCKNALRELMMTPPAVRLEMGIRARALIQEHHSLEVAVSRMRSAYSWVLGKTQRPDWVFTGVIPT